MANKYYVISGNPEVTQKNRNRFSLKKYLDDLYVIEDNKHSVIWLQGKNAVEKTLTEANEIITNRNNAITAQHSESYQIERQSKIDQYGPDDETQLEVGVGIGTEPILQDLITEE